MEKVTINKITSAYGKLTKHLRRGNYISIRIENNAVHKDDDRWYVLVPGYGELIHRYNQDSTMEDLKFNVNELKSKL